MTIDIRSLHGLDWPNGWTSEAEHMDSAQEDGGERDDAPITNEALPIGTQAQQTQTTSTKQAHGDRHDAGNSSVTAALLVSSTRSDAGHVPSSAIISTISIPTSDGLSDNISPVPTRSTMSTSAISSTKEELKGTLAPETVTMEPKSSLTMPVVSTMDRTFSISTSIPLTLAIEPVSTSTLVSGGASNGTTTPNLVPAGKSSTVNVAYAAIAPAVFVILVLAVLFVRRKQKRRRVLEAEANPRSEGVFPGKEEGVPIIAIPTPPSRRGVGRSSSNTLARHDGKRIEMQPLPLSRHPPLAGLRSHERARRENERELRDSDIYSPRYRTPSNHTSASSARQGQDQTRHPQTPRIGFLPSIPSIESKDPDGHPISPQTPPPTLPPLPSPDLTENWLLPSRMNSPTTSSPPAETNANASPRPRYLSSPVRSSPPRTSPSTSSRLQTENVQKKSPPIRGLAIASVPAQNLVVTPFHKNYKRISDAPASVASTSNFSCSTIPTHEASEVVLTRMERPAEVERTGRGKG